MCNNHGVFGEYVFSGGSSRQSIIVLQFVLLLAIFLLFFMVSSCTLILLLKVFVILHLCPCLFGESTHRPTLCASEPSILHPTDEFHRCMGAPNELGAPHYSFSRFIRHHNCANALNRALSNEQRISKDIFHEFPYLWGYLLSITVALCMDKKFSEAPS